MRGLKSVVAALALAAAPAAHAATFVVGAAANSSSGGTGLATVSLNAGDAFTVSASLTDIWNAGPLPRWSNANGLVAPLFATGTDESGAAAGTQIGAAFGTHTQSGLTAPFGALVGEIGGVYQFLGANFSGSAWGTGTLNLFYWDSNAGDNTDFITVDVSSGVVPEPASWAMLIAGFGLVGAAARRRRATTA